jgi:hypothetical protein
MPQPKIRSDQLNSQDFGTITSDGLDEALGAPVIIGSPISNGESLTFDGTNWVNSTSGGAGVTAGDGIDSTGGSPLGTQVISVDSTVARTDITTETFSFAGAVSLNLNDTSQGADEDIWRVGVTGGSFVISTRTDADGAGNSAITFARTGTTVDTATVPAPTHLTASGTGTSSALHLSSNVPTLVINDNDAAANAGIWDITSGTNQLLFRTRTDAHGTGATWLTVNRSGTTIGELAFTGTSMTMNGLPVVFGSPSGGSSDLGSPPLIMGDLTVTGNVTHGSPATVIPYEVIKRQLANDNSTYIGSPVSPIAIRVADLELPVPANSEWIFEGQLEVVIGGTGPQWEISFLGSFSNLKFQWWANDVATSEITGFSSGAIGHAGGEIGADDPGRSTGAPRCVRFAGTCEISGSDVTIGVAVRPQDGHPSVAVQINKNSWTRYTRLA